jgi:hypothetical protein
MKPGEEGVQYRPAMIGRPSNMPGFTADAGLHSPCHGVRQACSFGPLRADGAAAVIQPQFLRKLFRRVRPILRRPARVVGPIAAVEPRASRLPAFGVYCAGGLCRAIWSR